MSSWDALNSWTSGVSLRYLLPFPFVKFFLVIQITLLAEVILNYKTLLLELCIETIICTFLFLTLGMMLNHFMYMSYF